MAKDAYQFKKDAMDFIKKLIEKGEYDKDTIRFWVWENFGLSKKFTFDYIQDLINYRGYREDLKSGIISNPNKIQRANICSIDEETNPTDQ